MYVYRSVVSAHVQTARRNSKLECRVGEKDNNTRENVTRHFTTSNVRFGVLTLTRKGVNLDILLYFM